MGVREARAYYAAGLMQGRVCVVTGGGTGIGRAAALALADLGADVVVAAAGVPGLVTADMVKPGAAVVDVGITRTAAGLVGDVAPEVAEVAGHLAPVPGGAGPMTRAMLLLNVVESAERALAGRTATAGV